MAQLAIQGHSIRGKEVISYLKMLGGKNPYNCNGLGTLCAYRIIDGNIQITTIEDLFKSNEYTLYSLEGILAKFPYKVGNSARLSRSNVAVVIKAMKWENDEIVYKLSCDDSEWWSVNNLQPYKKETMEKRDKAMAPNLVGEDYSGKRFGYKIPQGYEFDCIQNNQIIIKPIKPQYPKTYVECCKVVNASPHVTLVYDLSDGQKYSYDVDNIELYNNFRRLKICRDAYYKIAGEQMGLGKPWKPDWKNDEQGRYMIMVYENKLYKDMSIVGTNFILVFPTEEMRDAFYENFEDLIGTCKELL